MKKTMMLLLTTTLLGFGSIASAATDYRQCPNQAFTGRQGRTCPAPASERNTFGFACQNRGPELGANGRECFNRPWEGRGGHCGINGLEQQLGLSKHQSAQMRSLGEKQFTLVVAAKKEIAALKQSLEDASLTTTPDQKKIDELSGKIGQQCASLARLKSNELTELVSILTPAQRMKFRTIRDARELRQHRGGF